MNKELIKEIEDVCDKTNCEYGCHNEYCIFCHSNDYNGSEGIIHDKRCIITKMRNFLKNG